MYKKLYTIGLTGGICSGKSTLKKFFLKYDNIKFLNFDDFTPIIYKRDTLLKKKIVETFGEQIIKNNEIDKKTLGSIVFRDKEKLALLKSLVSPAIIQFYFDQKNEIEFKNTTYDLLVVEGPTIIESKVHNLFDEIWLVYANDKEIERRFLQRIEKDENKLYNLNTLKDILSSQLPFEEKKKYAKVVIDTSGTVEETQAKARIHLENLFRQLNINYKSV